MSVMTFTGRPSEFIERSYSRERAILPKEPKA